jgi:hypothetical protein
MVNIFAILDTKCTKLYSRFSFRGWGWGGGQTTALHEVGITDDKFDYKHPSAILLTYDFFFL